VPRRLALIASLLVTLLAVTACQQTRTPVPLRDILPIAEGPEAADDIVFDRVLTYRANVHEAGKENPWPPIKVTEVTLHIGPDQVNVSYRDRIETAPGITRHNLFYIRGAEGPLDRTLLVLYSAGLPLGLEVFGDITGGLPGSIVAVLSIDVPAGMTSGQYSFEIGFEIDGRDYGTVPYAIKVTD